MPIKAREDTLRQLTLEDKKVLTSIYCHRCLDETLMCEYFYKELEAIESDYTLKRIRWMLRHELIAMDSFGVDEHCVFYLTNRGLQTVRAISETVSYTIDPKTGWKVYDVTSRQLQPANKLLNHQIHLNWLSLEIQRRCQLPDSCYKDSKLATYFTYAQPDGVFELPQYDLFLEMDMAHERQKELLRKWEHYRTYLQSRDYYLRRNKKIIVLFATENLSRGIAYRRSKVLNSLSKGIFDLIGDNFDCYIGPSAELAAITESIFFEDRDTAFDQAAGFLQAQYAFRFSRPAQVTELCGSSYLYMRQLGAETQNSKAQYYFLEDYTKRSIAVLKRIVNYENTASLLADEHGGDIPLLVIVNREDDIYQDLKTVEGFAVKNVYYTTQKRLTQMPFHEALFQFDKAGNRHHFTDYSFTQWVHEKRAI